MKKDREIMHNDKKDSELIAEYYDKYEQKLYMAGGGGCTGDISESHKIQEYDKKDAGGEEVGVHNQDCKKYRC